MPPPSRAREELHGTSLTLLEKLVCGGDSAAWERFFRLYKPLVYSWCRREGLQQADALDVCLDVLSGMRDTIHTYRQGHFRGWLRVVTRNRVTDFHRKRCRRERVVGGSSFAERVRQLPDSRQQADEAEEACDQAALYRRAAKLVAEDFRNEKYWPAFERYVIHQRPAAEVAAELGLSRETVYQIRKRVLRRLREEFRDLIDQGPGAALR
jgi:RNA polymerase sigma-70 factor (ECF subfamily)